MAWPNHFSEALLASFSRVCQGVALSLLFDLLCWMAWPAHFAKGLLSFVFVCLPGDCSAGWPGQIMLPQVLSHFYFFLPHDCFAGWLGMAWPDHFSKGLFDVLSFVARTIALLHGLARSF